MAKGQLDDPFYYNLSDGTNSTVVNPWGQGDSATALRVIHAGDATASISIVSNIATLDVQLVSGSVASVYVNNPSGAGDGATALRIIQAGDFVSSVYVNNPFGPGDSATALRMIYAGDSGASVNIISGSIANTGFNITGQTEGQGETDARTLRVIHAGDSGVSVNVTTALPTGANIIGALSANQSVNNAQISGNTFSVGDGEVGVGTMRVAHAGDFAVSVFVTGANDSMLTYMARTTNPTDKTDGADVRPIADKIGRIITAPYHVRDLVSTAFIRLATSAGYNTETTLIAIGAAGVSNDILQLSGTNDSTVAAVFDLRCGTANANISKRISIPAAANGMYHEDFNIPLLGEVTTPWTVKAFISGGGSADITGNNVSLHASYTKNV